MTLLYYIRSRTRTAILLTKLRISFVSVLIAYMFIQREKSRKRCKKRKKEKKKEKKRDKLTDKPFSTSKDGKGQKGKNWSF